MDRQRICRTAFAAALALALSFAGAAAAQDRERRDITRSFPAANLQAFRVDARVGDVRVRATNTNEVSLRLELEARREGSSWFGRDRKGDPHGVELEASTSSGMLRLTLRGERKGLHERWTLTVPARLAAEIELEVGDVEARDLAGGVRVHVNVGDITLDVARGAIDAEVNVGDIKARTATDAYEEVRLESSVGDADLRVGTNRIESRNKRRYGPGEDVRWSGIGRDRIRMEVNVGDASLVILKSSV